MLADSELALVQTVASGLLQPVTLRVTRADTGSTFETNLRNIARQVNGVSLDSIRLEEVGVSEDPLPFLSLGTGDGERIRYFAAPEGPELEPFLEAIKWMGTCAPIDTTRTPDGDEPGDEVCDLLIFIAPTCPHCPPMVRNIVSLAAEIPVLRLNIIDALHFSDWASRYRVQSTPTIVIDDGFTMVGHVGLDDLRSYVLRRADADFMTIILESMINAGRADDAAALLCRKQSPAAILPLYSSPVFSQRMGALVVMEEALATNPRILDPVVQELISFTAQEDDGLRGDTAELLGKIGNRVAIPALQKLQDDPNEDVREAAIEAIERLDGLLL